MMRKRIGVWILAGWLVSLLPAPGRESRPNLLISDISVLDNDFIAVRLENRANVEVAVSDSLRQKVFLAVSINGVLRAVYRVKYVDPTIFLGRSVIWIQTSFRLSPGLNVKAVVDPEGAIAETDEADNTLEKTFAPHVF